MIFNATEVSNKRMKPSYFTQDKTRILILRFRHKINSILEFKLYLDVVNFIGGIEF